VSVANPPRDISRRSITVRLAPNEDAPDGVNCAVCHTAWPELSFSYQLHGAAVTAGICEECCKRLERGGRRNG